MSRNAWIDNLEDIFRHRVGMTTHREVYLLETYARDAYTGQGKIVDLGCWFGATTFAFSRGLVENKVATGQYRIIEAVDIFVWQNWMNRHGPTKYRAGDSFYEEVKNEYANVDFVKVVQRDLLNILPESDPVEFLFIDAMKSWPLANSIIHSYFPSLIPGVSYIVHQDFGWPGAVTSTNHLSAWWFRDSLVPVYTQDSSVVFECVKPITTSGIKFTPDLFSDEAVIEAYDWCAANIPKCANSLRISHLLHLVVTKRQSAAIKQFHQVQDVKIPKAAADWAIQAIKNANLDWGTEILDWFSRQC